MKRGLGTEIQQLLKLLDDDHYVSRYKSCEDEVTIQDIYWTRPDSIKLFKTFPIMLIFDSTYKTNKYRLPILKFVSVTSTKMTFSGGLAFLESKKEDNVTWALEACKTMFKDQQNMPNVIVIDRDTALMNSVARVFPTSYALLCSYHITKNVRNILKCVVRAKQIKGEDEKIVKAFVVVERIIDAWNYVINSSTEELYDDFVIHFWKCVRNIQIFGNMLNVQF